MYICIYKKNQLQIAPFSESLKNEEFQPGLYFVGYWCFKTTTLYSHGFIVKECTMIKLRCKTFTPETEANPFCYLFVHMLIHVKELYIQQQFSTQSHQKLKVEFWKNLEVMFYKFLFFKKICFKIKIKYAV